MGWANAGYAEAVMEALGRKVRTGGSCLARAETASAVPVEAVAALRRYSTSEWAGQEDGKTLNASLASADGKHLGWASDLDGAFVHVFPFDVLLWRGGWLPPAGLPAPCFVSCSLSERRARQFRNHDGARLNAVVLSAGFPVAIPASVWRPGDDERTLGVVRRELEIVLPRGTAFSRSTKVDPFADTRPGKAAVFITRAAAPEPRFDPTMRAVT